MTDSPTLPDLIFLDNHLMTVNKPPGLLVQGDITGDPTLLDISKTFLKTNFKKPGNVFLGIVHRLDRPVSGVILFARTSKAASRLSEQFKQKIPIKKYLALVKGNIPTSDTLENYIERVGSSSKISRKNKGQYARLHYEKINTLTNHSLIEVTLDTGRHHQIRVQLANIGFPIIGDFRYGSKEKFPLKSIALHAHSLEVHHPVRKEPISFHAPLPSTWPMELQSACMRR